MKFVITKKSVRIGGAVSEIKVVRIKGIKIREAIRVSKHAHRRA